MQIRIFLFLAISLTSATGHAQQVYRCGSTFSQQRCGPDAKVIGKPAPAVAAVKKREPVPDNPPPEAVATANKTMCERQTRAALKDPESARLGTVTRTGAGHHYHSASRSEITGSSYVLMVNAKNSYGGYTGEKLWACVFTLDETALLAVYQLDR